jgi:hypothetical protein
LLLANPSSYWALYGANEIDFFLRNYCRRFKICDENSEELNCFESTLNCVGLCVVFLERLACLLNWLLGKNVAELV